MHTLSVTMPLRPNLPRTETSVPARVVTRIWARLCSFHLCRGRATFAMRRLFTPFRPMGHLQLCALALVLLLPPVAVALFAPPPLALAVFTNGAGDADVTGGVSGRTIIAEVNYSDYASSSESSCTWKTTVISSPNNEPYSFIVRNGVTYRWYVRTCTSPTNPSAAADLTFHWVPVVTEETLAQQASASSWSLLPVPYVGTAPPAQRGVVNLPMWWWVTPASWRPISATAWVPTPRGPLIVKTTAKPSQLIVNPGDPNAKNTGKFTCSGPGDAWNKRDGDTGTSNCMYTYKNSSSRAQLKATVAIKWTISWSSNWGKKGKLPSVTTTRRIPVTVGEIQALVTQ
jgi:hypothetical protein